jgi:hypothetical protein
MFIIAKVVSMVEDKREREREKEKTKQIHPFSHHAEVTKATVSF